MGIIELFFLAIGLSMDAFAVSVCKGLAMKKATFENCAICGLWFGGFQALMPLIGYAIGSRFEKYVETYAPWIAFVLLTLIGVNMIIEALSKKDDDTSAELNFKTMFFMAVATSIDALAIGITFACISVYIVPANALTNVLIGCSIIGIITFVIACVGVKIGSIFGTKFKSKADLAGGIILILIGMKIIF